MRILIQDCPDEATTHAFLNALIKIMPEGCQVMIEQTNTYYGGRPACSDDWAQKWLREYTKSHPEDMLLHDQVKDDQRPEHGADK